MFFDTKRVVRYNVEQICELKCPAQDPSFGYGFVKWMKESRCNIDSPFWVTLILIFALIDE